MHRWAAWRQNRRTVLLRTEENNSLGKIDIEQRKKQTSHRRVDAFPAYTHLVFPQLVGEVWNPPFLSVFFETASQSIAAVRTDNRSASSLFLHILSDVARMHQKRHQTDKHDSFRAQDASRGLVERSRMCPPSFRVGGCCLRGRRTSFRTDHSSQKRARERSDGCL